MGRAPRPRLLRLSLRSRGGLHPLRHVAGPRKGGWRGSCRGLVKGSSAWAIPPEAVAPPMQLATMWLALCWLDKETSMAQYPTRVGTALIPKTLRESVRRRAVAERPRAYRTLRMPWAEQALLGFEIATGVVPL